MAFEFSKYALIVLLTIAIIRYRRVLLINKWAIIFLLLLIPGIIIRPTFSRSAIIFNLAGPLVLALSVMFLSTVELKWEQFRLLVFFIAAPLIIQVEWSVLQARNFLALGVVRFGNDSNAWLAGGEGPNQVATILGFGAALCFLYAITRRGEKRLRFVLFVSSLIFLTQAVITFSRGGVITGIGMVLVAGYYLIRIPRVRKYYTRGALLAVLVFSFLIFPLLNDLTQGTLGVRVSSFTLTGRDAIAQSNLQLFLDNPILGVGVGVSDEISGTPHTEFTRMLAEHGLFGIAAIGVLMIMSIQRLMSDRLVLNKAFIVAFTAWSLATMLHSATRLAAVGFVFGLGAIVFSLEDELTSYEPEN